MSSVFVTSKGARQIDLAGAWGVALLGVLLVAACRVSGAPPPAGVVGGRAGGLPTSIPPRRSVTELGAPPLHVAEVRWRVFVDGVPPPQARFPLARGVDIDAAGAPPGTRYLILGVDYERGRTIRVGEVELTNESCPPGEDGSPLPCTRCPAVDTLRFARWLDAPATSEVAELAAHGVLLAVGPVTSGRRVRWERALVHAPCELPGSTAGWNCEWAIDLEGDEHVDLVRAINRCPPSDATVVARSDPRDRDPRCFADERWRQVSGRWWATEWSPYADDVSIPFLFAPLQGPGLEIFSVFPVPSQPGDRGQRAVQLSSLTTDRPARPESVYVLVDGRGPVALAQTGASPERRRSVRALVAASPPLRAPLYAIGPVPESAFEWERVRVTSEYPEVRSPVLAMPYEPTDRGRIVLGVDLDVDGQPDLELRASIAASVRVSAPQRFVRLELWTGHDGSRALREYAHYSLGTRGYVLVEKCDVSGTGPSY